MQVLQVYHFLLQNWFCIAMHVFQSWPSFCKPLATSVHLFRILENWTLTNIWRFSLLKRWNIFSIYSMYPLVVLSLLSRLTWSPNHNVGCVTFKYHVDYDLTRLSVQMYHSHRTIPDICHFFTQAKFLGNKIYTKKRQFFALNL